MFYYGKTAANAIAVASYLAQHSNSAADCASAAEIAEKRGLSRAFAAKLLSQLSQVGVIAGTPGPKGGYYLSKPADQIMLMDVVKVFEKIQDETLCPFGSGWCGHQNPCPMHNDILRLREQANEYLTSTSLAIFCENTVPA